MTSPSTVDRSKSRSIRIGTMITLLVRDRPLRIQIAIAGGHRRGALPQASDTVMSSMGLRLGLGALGMVLVVAALVLWHPWTGQLEGKMSFTACGGPEPMNPPPGYNNCHTMAAGGADVTAAPASGGPPTQVTADSSGHYKMRLMPGPYYLSGTTIKPYHLDGSRRLVPVSANSTLHLDVNVALYAP